MRKVELIKWTGRFLKIVLISLLFSCASKREICVGNVVDLQSAILLKEYISDKPLHYIIKAELAKGFFKLQADGDIVFTPPDTLRMELRSPWGETLFDLHTFGDSVCLYFAGSSRKCYRGEVSGLKAKSIPPLLSGRSGISTFLDTTKMQKLCEDGKPLFIYRNNRVFLNKEGRLIEKVEIGGGKSTIIFSKYEKFENGVLPSEYLLNIAGAGSIKISVLKRKIEKR